MQLFGAEFYGDGDGEGEHLGVGDRGVGVCVVVVEGGFEVRGGEVQRGVEREEVGDPGGVGEGAGGGGVEGRGEEGAEGGLLDL